MLALLRQQSKVRSNFIKRPFLRFCSNGDVHPKRPVLKRATWRLQPTKESVLKNECNTLLCTSGYTLFTVQLSYIYSSWPSQRVLWALISPIIFGLAIRFLVSELDLNLQLPSYLYVRSKVLGSSFLSVSIFTFPITIIWEYFQQRCVFCNKCEYNKRIHQFIQTVKELFIVPL